MCQTEKNIKHREQEVEEKLGRTTKYMEHVRDIGNTSKEEELILVKRRLLQIVTELEDIKEDLVYLVRDQLSPRQLALLLETNDEDQAVDTDPSVQFFGVEWNSVFARCFSLGLNIRIFKQRQQDGFLDVTGLACLLSDLCWVRRQMELHSVAFSSGVTSQAYLARQLQLQLQVTQAGQVKSKSVKYDRKHKTENLNNKISRSHQGDRRRSLCPESTSRKKSSFLGNVSTLLNYVRKN